ncbi:MAG: hypothetical protein ACRD8Z_15770 [Nitrososphaeraceae archaeon]
MRPSNFVCVSVGVAAAMTIVVIVVATMSALGTSVLGQSDQSDVVLLSNRFNQDSFSSEVIGEVLNNGTRPLDKYDINIIASFYDSAGVLVGSEQGFIDAQTLGEGDRSAFNVFTTDEAIMNEAATYDMSINDARVLEDAPIDGDGNNESENGSGGGSSNSNDEGEDENSDGN